MVMLIGAAQCLVTFPGVCLYLHIRNLAFVGL